ncbi:hypothetical protein QBC34DRAFT_437012 [Podospora aff. communis PSN243]|uniref:Uncharacterized protein n=1 Tax=Podospora aff. communis PSN243 TaxID=3040156 RepID=A0AAV9GSQ5_9PEZI|nr:hypothetical protein QBC34DRAFT_437012 [Podospora aff. communis PSN243]
MLSIRTMLSLGTLSLAFALPTEAAEPTLTKRSPLRAYCEGVQNAGFFAGNEFDRLRNMITGPDAILRANQLWQDYTGHLASVNSACWAFDELYDS